MTDRSQLVPVIVSTGVKLSILGLPSGFDRCPFRAGDQSVGPGLNCKQSLLNVANCSRIRDLRDVAKRQILAQA